ncbi:hypothetical protein DFH09DRAFT_254668 [Mycena vulgaris]|nr:hypothetical protein DFH09DRAFT_254668 [Mycena vulgaris]
MRRRIAVSGLERTDTALGRPLGHCTCQYDLHLFPAPCTAHATPAWYYYYSQRRRTTVPPPTHLASSFPSSSSSAHPARTAARHVHRHPYPQRGEERDPSRRAVCAPRRAQARGGMRVAPGQKTHQLRLRTSFLLPSSLRPRPRVPSFLSSPRANPAPLPARPGSPPWPSCVRCVGGVARSGVRCLGGSTAVHDATRSGVGDAGAFLRAVVQRVKPPRRRARVCPRAWHSGGAASSSSPSALGKRGRGVRRGLRRSSLLCRGTLCAQFEGRVARWGSADGASWGSANGGGGVCGRESRVGTA